MSTKRNSTKSSTQPQELTRRQLLASLVALPLLPLTQALPTPTAPPAEQPPTAPVVAGDISTDEIACITRVLIPALEECLVNARARLAELTTAAGGAR